MIVAHWPLAAVLVLFAAYAASTHVDFGSVHLLALPTPDWFQQLSGNLRVHGRFIWPLMYVLILAPAAWLARGRTPPLVTALLILGLAVQAVEAAPTVRWGRAYTGTPTEPLFDAPRMAGWIAQHDRIWQYPSWYCGALEPVHEEYLRARKRISQLQVLAARLNKPNNSVHMARPLTTCFAEREWAITPQLAPGTLYILVKDTRLDSPRVAALEHTDRCVDVGWSYVCSASPLVASNQPPAATGAH